MAGALRSHRCGPCGGRHRRAVHRHAGDRIARDHRRKSRHAGRRRGGRAGRRHATCAQGRSDAVGRAKHGCPRHAVERRPGRRRDRGRPAAPDRTRAPARERVRALHGGRRRDRGRGRGPALDGLGPSVGVELRRQRRRTRPRRRRDDIHARGGRGTGRLACGRRGGSQHGRWDVPRRHQRRGRRRRRRCRGWGGQAREHADDGPPLRAARAEREGVGVGDPRLRHGRSDAGDRRGRAPVDPHRDADGRGRRPRAAGSSSGRAPTRS